MKVPPGIQTMPGWGGEPAAAAPGERFPDCTLSPVFLPVCIACPPVDEVSFALRGNGNSLRLRRHISKDVFLSGRRRQATDQNTSLDTYLRASFPLHWSRNRWLSVPERKALSHGKAL